MIDRVAWSRPLRWATILSRIDEGQMKDYLRHARVAVRMERGFDHRDARETLLLAVNMLLRFCPEITLVLDTRHTDLAVRAKRLGVLIVRSDAAVQVLSEDPNWNAFDVVITIGQSPAPVPGAITINSAGWVARMATGPDTYVPHQPSKYNAIGALAAACLGVGAASTILLKLPPATHAFELSLFDHATGEFGSLEPGPLLPSSALEIDALLFGCGGVTNGWAYAIRRLPVRGVIEAVDKQSLRKENLGPYVLSSWSDLDKPKAVLIRRALAPRFKVTPRPEPLEFYMIRLDQKLVSLPQLVIAGLDDIPPRHTVQRLWPRVLIDLAGGGTTTQLVVHHAGGDGMCVLEALRAPEGRHDFAAKMAAATGLSAERIRNNPTDPISLDDVQSAPPEYRSALEAARRDGRLICGRVTDHNLLEEAYTDDFAPAVPFVSAFSGIDGAASTMRVLMGLSIPIHHQFDFKTLRGRAIRLRRSPECECSGVV